MLSVLGLPIILINKFLQRYFILAMAGGNTGHYHLKLSLTLTRNILSATAKVYVIALQ